MLNIKRPTLLIDQIKVKANIARMAQKAVRHDIKLSPHFKTHQSRMIGNWYKEEGIDSATVSSMSMARYFVENGWHDMTVAFPLNILELEDAYELATKADLTLLVDSFDTVKAIRDYKGRTTSQLKILIEIDAGYHRTGVDANDIETLKEIIDAVEQTESLNFLGFYCHSGDSYKCRSDQEIERVHERTREALAMVRRQFSRSFPDLILSLGDTPSCSISESFDGIEIIRPGNFIFYDLMQEQIGSCAEDQIAVAMVCPVVYMNRERLELTVYGGGVHFSKDAMEDDGVKIFGKMVDLGDEGWSNSKPGCYLKSISQEHGILKVDIVTFDSIKIGDLVGILPVHSCMTADLMGSYTDFAGQVYDHMSGNKFDF